MQMATVGAAICMSHGTDCNLTKVIYAAAIATAWCNLKGGANERVARKHHATAGERVDR